MLDVHGREVGERLRILKFRRIFRVDKREAMSDSDRMSAGMSGHVAETAD